MIRPLRYVAIVGIVVATAAIAFGSKDDSLVQQVRAACVPLAFGDPPIVRPIDHATNGCDLDGEPSATDPADQAKQEAQNQAKNEFCAWQNTDPALVTRFSFDQLQSCLPSGFPWGSRSNMATAEERKAIRAFYTTSEGDTIGEGSYVQLALYLLEGNFGGVESVNCGRSQQQDIDIHLALVKDRPWTLDLKNRGPVECASVTAEISPHHRPIDWDLLGRMTGTPAAQKLVKAQQKLADENLQRPLRIRGHLFFGASHGLCRGRRRRPAIHRVDPVGRSIPSTVSTCANSRRWRRVASIARMSGHRWRTGYCQATCLKRACNTTLTGASHRQFVVTRIVRFECVLGY